MSLNTEEPRHCDDYIRDKSQPMCLRRFLFVNRLPAYMKYERWINKGKPEPVLFATIKDDSKLDRFKLKNGDRVRVVMASRFGDVGITRKLKENAGYLARVPVEWLTDFSEEPGVK